MELNPNNEALTQLREHWQKVLMLVMKKEGIKECTLDLIDMEWLIEANKRGEMPFMLTLGRKQLGSQGGFTLVLCDSQSEAVERMAKHQGQG